MLNLGSVSVQGRFFSINGQPKAQQIARTSTGRLCFSMLPHATMELLRGLERLYPWSLAARSWKIVVGRLLSYWEGHVSGLMLDFGGVMEVFGYFFGGMEGILAIWGGGSRETPGKPNSETPRSHTTPIRIHWSMWIVWVPLMARGAPIGKWRRSLPK